MITEAQGGRVRRLYHPELDVLRFIAFLAVFVHHALPGDTTYFATFGDFAPWLAAGVQAGAFGVDVFFALSAYLITTLLLREQQQTGQINIGAFYLRRILRIWPLYFVFLALVASVVPTILSDDYLNQRAFWAFSLFGANWYVAWYGYPLTIAAPLWSISVEEQFYVLWPLTLRIVGFRRIHHVILVLIGVAALTRVLLMAVGVAHPGVWTNTLARLDPIAGGALLAVTFDRAAPPLNAGLRALLSSLSIIMIILVARYAGFDGAGSLWGYPVVAGGSVSLLVAVLNAQLLQLKYFAPLAYLGRISYGLYVFHVFALRLTERLTLPFIFQIVLAFGITVVLAILSYTVLERPFLCFRDRYRAGAVQPSTR